MMHKFYVITYFVFYTGIARAQQDALYSQYMFNQFVINPAYAGSRGMISSVLVSRSQWVNINGAPQTSTFSIQAPFSKQKMALGLQMFVDKIGPSKNNGGYLSYAYHIKTNKGKLALGLRGGIYSAELNWNALVYENQNDQFIGTRNAQTTAPSFDAGTYYYTDKFYFGASITHINKPKIDYLNAPENTNFYLRRHIFIMTGYAHKANDKWILKPSLMLRKVGNLPINADINFSALYNKSFQAGISFRSSRSIVFLTEFIIKESLRVGYSADISLNRLRSYSGLSHEIMIGYDFNLLKTKSVSPRYL
jgi:type IX secretion system PorP/SprF family membrane protein